MSKLTKLDKYFLEKCFIGNGVINGIVNALIFYGAESAHKDKMFSLTDVLKDISFTVFLLGLLLVLIVHPLTVKDIKSGKLEKASEPSKLLKVLPKKKGLASLVVGLIAVAICVPLTALAAVALKLTPITYTGMGIFKGVICAIAGTLSGYLTVVHVRNYYEVAQEDNTSKELSA